MCTLFPILWRYWIMELYLRLESAKYFSIFDFASGFYQISMHESDAVSCRWKTMFSISHRHYHFRRMPFRLRNTPAMFQRLWVRYYQNYKGICLFILMTSSFTHLSWPNTKQNEINLPNDYDRRIISYNRTKSVSAKESKLFRTCRRG